MGSNLPRPIGAKKEKASIKTEQEIQSIFTKRTEYIERLAESQERTVHAMEQRNIIEQDKLQLQAMLDVFFRKHDRKKHVFEVCSRSVLVDRECPRTECSCTIENAQEHNFENRYRRQTDHI